MRLIASLNEVMTFDLSTGNLKFIIEQFDQKIPIIALTATATPKVQEDVMKNLGILNAKIFKSSFNRPNLYYEVRAKTKYRS